MDIKEYYEEQEMIKDLSEFVSIPSVYDPTTESEEMPFGEGVHQGLLWILEKARSFGMTTKNIDGYAGEITVGHGEKMIGILAHEDVVVAGEGWDTEAFCCQVKDGKIIGRGTSDDKGPLISCLYVMKYLKDAQLIPEDMSIRMIVGTNEEEEWKGIEYYTSHADRLPDYSIVPDGYFPLVCCEKGLFDFNMTASPDLNTSEDAVKVMQLYGGVGRNIVPASAACVMKCRSAEDASEIMENLRNFANVKVETEGEIATVRAFGKSTHAMAPEEGMNAISILMDALGNIKLPLSIGRFVENYNIYIGLDYNADKFGCGFEDEISGKTTLNIGTIAYEENHVLMEANLRYPASEEKEVVKNAMLATMEKAHFQYGNELHLPPIYVEPESKFAQTLMQCYQEVTGDDKTQPLLIGGATYARAIPNAVSFGPLFPYETELAHEPNEYLAVDSLKKMTEIFCKGILCMMGL